MYTLTGEYDQTDQYTNYHHPNSLKQCYNQNFKQAFSHKNEFLMCSFMYSINDITIDQPTTTLLAYLIKMLTSSFILL